MQSRKIQRNERTSGSLCSAAARDPESLRAGIGPAEAGERDPRQERARNEGRGPETGGERILVRPRRWTKLRDVQLYSLYIQSQKSVRFARLFFPTRLRQAKVVDGHPCMYNYFIPGT